MVTPVDVCAQADGNTSTDCPPLFLLTTLFLYPKEAYSFTMVVNLGARSRLALQIIILSFGTVSLSVVEVEEEVH